MLKYIECTGKNEEEAIAAALRQLGLDRDEVSVEVLERAKSGFLGIGGSPAKIKVTYEVPDEPVPVPVVEKKPASTAEKEPDPAVERAEDTAAPADLTSQTTAAPEELGDKAESIDRFLTGLMAHMEVEATPKITMGEERQLQGGAGGMRNLGALIGRRGETLDAIQQLTSYAVNRGASKRSRIHVVRKTTGPSGRNPGASGQKGGGKDVKYRRNVTLDP